MVHDSTKALLQSAPCFWEVVRERSFVFGEGYHTKMQSTSDDLGHGHNLQDTFGSRRSS